MEFVPERRGVLRMCRRKDELDDVGAHFMVDEVTRQKSDNVGNSLDG